MTKQPILAERIDEANRDAEGNPAFDGYAHQSIDTRITAALGDGKLSADDLESLAAEVEKSMEDATQAVAVARDEYLNRGSINAEEAAQRVSVAELKLERLQLALPRLQQKLAATLADDYSDRWHSDANRVEAQAAEAEKGLANYASLAEQIVALIAAVEAANKESSRVNGGAVDGEHRRLPKVDIGPLKDLVLPGYWPPKQLSVAQSFFESIGTLSPTPERFMQRREEPAAPPPVDQSAAQMKYLTALQNAKLAREEAERISQHRARSAGR